MIKILLSKFYYISLSRNKQGRKYHLYRCRVTAVSGFRKRLKQRHFAKEKRHSPKDHTVTCNQDALISFGSLLLLSGNIMYLQEFLEDLLAFGSGPDGILQFLEAAQIPGPALERDLGGPAAGSLIPIDSPHPAGIVGEHFLTFNALQAGALHKVPGVYRVYPAAAASGMSALQVGLA